MSSKMILKSVLTKSIIKNGLKCFSTTSTCHQNYKCKVLVVGGGAGGCAVSAKLSRDVKSKSELIVLEPSNDHYYQPMFTLVGGGIYTVEDSKRAEKNVLPDKCTWVKDGAKSFDLKNNTVHTKQGGSIQYEFLLVAVGLELRYDKIPGLTEALEKPTLVCSIYSPKYAEHTYKVLENLKSGNALFTFPNSPVKCPGAPQKICYLVEDFLRKNGRRNDVKISYYTSLPVIFGVKTYADALWKVCKTRDIDVNLKTNLKSVDAAKNEAVFENLDNPEQTSTVNFSMLHVTPPMATPSCISSNKDLSNAAGMVEVDKATLQHVRYPNVFAIGDCGSTPNSKTAAAVAAQSGVVHQNMVSVMNGKPLSKSYDGYASCPLVTGYDKCILAEFDYNLNPLETFPFRQDRELYSMYFLKKNVMPSLYWHLMTKGNWNGPSFFRKVMRLGL